VIEAREELERLRDREQRVELALLKDEPDALAPRAGRPAWIDAEDRDLPAAPVPVALEDLDGRGLPRSVRAEESEHLARLHLEIEAPQDIVASVGLAQALHVDRRHAPDCKASP